MQCIHTIEGLFFFLFVCFLRVRLEVEKELPSTPAGKQWCAVTSSHLLRPILERSVKVNIPVHSYITTARERVFLWNLFKFYFSVSFFWKWGSLFCSSLPGSFEYHFLVIFKNKTCSELLKSYPASPRIVKDSDYIRETHLRVAGGFWLNTRKRLPFTDL